MLKQISPASGYRIHMKTLIPKSGNYTTNKHGREDLAYTLMIKQHKVKLKQTWVVEIELNVLNHSM